jgi:hypothetical protein
MAREIVTSENKAEYDAKKMGIKKEPDQDFLHIDGNLQEQREHIQNEAESFAERLKKQNFQADVEHSGSVAGASSYVKIYDPETKRFFTDPIRFSVHSKGVKGSTLVNHVRHRSDLDKYEKMAHEMRNRPLSENEKLRIVREKEQEEKAEKIRAKKQAKQKSSEIK